MTKPSVLVVDDDQACLDEYVSTLSELGFACRAASLPTDALRILTDDESIGVLLTDIRMPEMSGVELVRLQASQSGPERFIVPIFITAYGDVDIAVEALRLEAADFLRKPVTRSELVNAMARAQSIWTARTKARDAVPAPDQAQQIMDLVAELKQARQLAGNDAGHGKASGMPVQKRIEEYIANRRQRARHFPDLALDDASWNILLDLALAYIKGKPVAVSSACIASEAPISTALRRIRDLCDAGLLTRWPDPTDGRRDMVSLTETCFQSVEAYFSLHFRGE